MFKKVYLSIFIFIVIVSFSGYYIYQNKKVEDTRISLEAVTGHNLFLLITTYESIYEDNNGDDLTIKNITNIKDEISLIKEYSKDIDLSVGYHLEAIAIKFEKIINHLGKNYYINNGFTEEDIVTFDELISMTKELKGIIVDTYYVKDDHYGGKANLFIKNFDDIDNFDKKLNEYIKSKNIY